MAATNAAAIGNQMTLAGWSRTDGYAALEPSKSLDYFQLPALRVASTRWVHRSPSTSVIEGLTPYDENWMQVPDPLPLVRLVTHVVPSDDPAADLAKIDIRREALCEYALALPPGKAGTATLIQHRAGQMAVKVCCCVAAIAGDCRELSSRLAVHDRRQPQARLSRQRRLPRLRRRAGQFRGPPGVPSRQSLPRPARHSGRPGADRPLSLHRRRPAGIGPGGEDRLEPRVGVGT